METSATVPSHPRVNVRWPVLYHGEDFVAEGTMCDISLQGGRFAGTMPVTVGMLLGVFIDHPQKSGNLIVAEAVVTWVNEDEFWADFLKMQAEEMQWLREHLEITTA